MATTAKHTPEPWRIDLPDFDDVHEEYHDNRDDLPPFHGFASISSDKWERFAYVAVCCGGDPDDAGLATALLFLNSPGLLAACETALAALDTCGNLAATPERMEAESKARAALQTAIAKATGK